ncbi:YdbL family protein [Pseudoalteromonas sp. MMG012]|uniref:YdbL family protein n=1 Tax=Pseudoalteromonas sp. MMG012 TaxID=2822686 RepID=UPI001B3A5C50|nr:YdbL family protein [Pseudoalteromonas sp. MMG012]MBQ4848956.1 YdbL family protein [Pseudoalteromonas sp. MMG012]
MKIIKLALVAIAFSMTFSALALTLTNAKSQGLVGETESGYLALVTSNPQAQALIKSVNAKRKSKYAQLAKKNNLSLSQVETLAGQKAVAKTASGHFIKVNGQWIKK